MIYRIILALLLVPVFITAKNHPTTRVKDIFGNEVMLVFYNDSELPRAEYTIIEGKICNRVFYTWDNKGRIKEQLIDDGCKEGRNHLAGVNSRTRLSFHHSKKTNEVEIVCEEASSPEFYYEVVNVTTKDSPYDNKKKNTGAFSFFQDCFDNLMSFWGKQTAVIEGGWDSFDQGMKHIFGEANLFMWGVYPEKIETGVVGLGELSPLIRITGINGILNKNTDCHDLAKMISDLHGGENIHYIFWPSEGWTRDVIRGLAAQAGFHSSVTEELANKWKALIQEMGGVDSGGMIIHYAHSIGSISSKAALDLLTKKERNMIKMYAFGPPSILENKGCLEIINYVSIRDGVCMLDAIHYIEAISGEQDHVIFVGDYWGPPLIDHSIVNGAYLEVLEELGKAFQEEFIH